MVDRILGNVQLANLSAPPAQRTCLGRTERVTRSNLCQRAFVFLYPTPFEPRRVSLRILLMGRSLTLSPSFSLHIIVLTRRHRQLVGMLNSRSDRPTLVHTTSTLDPQHCQTSWLLQRVVAMFRAAFGSCFRQIVLPHCFSRLSSSFLSHYPPAAIPRTAICVSGASQPPSYLVPPRRTARTRIIFNSGHAVSSNGMCVPARLTVSMRRGSAISSGVARCPVVSRTSCVVYR
jgi:hypothetical protein